MAISDDAFATAKEVFAPNSESLSFEEIQARLVALKPELDKYTKIKKEYDILREAAQYEMLANGVKATLPYKGYSLVLAERKTPVIVDEKSAWDWLSDNVDDIERFLKLDAPKVIDFTDKWFAETGEIVTGVETQITQYCSVKRVK